MTTSTEMGHAYLLLDDDDVFRGALARALTRRGARVIAAASCAEARSLFDAHAIDRAVVDLRLPDASGLDAVKYITERRASTDVVVLTGYGSIATAVESLRLGARQYLCKPIDASEVIAAFGTPEPAVPAHDTPSLARVEWEHIHRVLADCHGNISEAARRLGLHRRSLQRKLQKMPMSR